MAKPPVKGHADYFAPGDWNVTCAFCGRKFKASECRKLPEGDPLGGNAWVCLKHWRPRQPQDFVRGIPENMAAPFQQPPVDSYISDFCTLEGMTALADWAVADCCICDYLPTVDYTDDLFELATEEDEDDLILTDTGEGIFV